MQAGSASEEEGEIVETKRPGRTDTAQDKATKTKDKPLGEIMEEEEEEEEGEIIDNDDSHAKHAPVRNGHSANTTKKHGHSYREKDTAYAKESINPSSSSVASRRSRHSHGMYTQQQSHHRHDSEKNREPNAQRHRDESMRPSQRTRKDSHVDYEKQHHNRKHRPDSSQTKKPSKKPFSLDGMEISDEFKKDALDGLSTKRPEGSKKNPQLSLMFTSNPLAADNPLRKHTFRGCSSIHDYVRLDKVGEGTFGEVHKARHKTTGQVVALKKILVQNVQEGFPLTALREIRFLKKLDFPNVMRVLDMAVNEPDPTSNDQDDVEFFMVFPYMDHDLAGLLDAPNVVFSPAQIKCYMKQLLTGIFNLHRAKVIHRDIKSANILLNNRGELQIGDFGLARPIDPSREGYTVGVVTRWYRPPELLLGSSKYDQSIDMWSVGCIFAEMFVGKPILQGESDIHQLEIIMKLCGPISEETMPGCTSLPGFATINSTNYENCLRTTFSKYDEHAIDLLQKMLTLDPKKRISALDALDHDYFWTDPVPLKPSELPSYPPCHELDKRKRQFQKQEKSRMQAMESTKSQVASHQYKSRAHDDRSRSRDSTTDYPRSRKGHPYHAPAESRDHHHRHQAYHHHHSRSEHHHSGDRHDPYYPGGRYDHYRSDGRHDPYQSEGRYAHHYSDGRHEHYHSSGRYHDQHRSSRHDQSRASRYRDGRHYHPYESDSSSRTRNSREHDRR